MKITSFMIFTKDSLKNGLDHLLNTGDKVKELLTEENLAMLSIIEDDMIRDKQLIKFASVVEQHVTILPCDEYHGFTPYLIITKTDSVSCDDIIKLIY